MAFVVGVSALIFNNSQILQKNETLQKKKYEI